MSGMVEQRKARRFEIRLPVRILRHGSRPCTGQGETRNLSSRGVLFVSNAGLSVGERVEYLISLPGGRRRESPLELYCLGKVLRSEKAPAAADSNAIYAIAVTLERYEFVRFGQS